jgi:hypothetical protein
MLLLSTLLNLNSKMRSETLLELYYSLSKRPLKSCLEGLSGSSIDLRMLEKGSHDPTRIGCE